MSRFTEQVHAVIEDLKDITVSGTSYITAVDANEGLAVNAGSLGTVIYASGGLEVGASGFGVKLNGASLTLGASGLSVTTPATNYITAVDANEGLEVNAGSLGTVINASGGLQVGASGFGVKLNGATLSLGASGISVRALSRGVMSLASTATTTIAAPYTFVLVSGTTIASFTRSFSVSATNRITYTGTPAITARMHYTASVHAETTGAIRIQVKVTQNGTSVSQTSTSITEASLGDQHLSGCAYFSLATNDYLEMFVANYTNTVNVVFETMCLLVEETH